jgi:hypothetical protein
MWRSEKRKTVLSQIKSLVHLPSTIFKLYFNIPLFKTLLQANVSENSLYSVPLVVAEYFLIVS